MLVGSATAGGRDETAPGFLQTQVSKRNFLEWNDQNVDLMAKNSPQHADFYNEYDQTVRPIFQNPRRVDQEFGRVSVDAPESCWRTARDDKFNAYLAGLTHRPSKALAKLKYEAL